MLELAEWLSTTPLMDLSLWIASWPLSEVIQMNFWVIPTLQTIHILSIAAAFGAVFMINLRILGLAGRARTMTRVSQRYLPWVWWGLLALLLSGLAMTIGEPARQLVNPVFWMKMILVVFAVLVSVWFQFTVRRNIAFWEAGAGRRAAIRVAAVGVIVLWGTIAVLGRWIAYAPV